MFKVFYIPGEQNKCLPYYLVWDIDMCLYNRGVNLLVKEIGKLSNGARIYMLLNISRKKNILIHI